MALLLPIRLSSTMNDRPDSLGAQGVELGEDLRAGLDSRLAAEGDDDVAELALKRAAARELDVAEEVVAAS